MNAEAARQREHGPVATRLPSWKRFATKVLSASAPAVARLVRTNALFVTGLVIPLALIYGSALAAHSRRSMNPYVFNDDVRIWIFPCFRYHEPGVFPADYLGTYLLNCCEPLGYRAFYALGALFWDPAVISKIVPYLLLVVTLIAIGIAARRLSGFFGALFATALVLSNPLFLERMAGGLQRAFGFPLLATLAVALAYGKPRLAASVICCGAAFYPPTAVVGGIALALWLLLLPAGDRGEAAEWAFSRRARLIAITAAICAAIVAPNFFSARSYGRALGPKDIIEYPEVGVGGRFIPSDRSPFDSFFKAALDQGQALFATNGKPYSQRVQRWLGIGDVRNRTLSRDVIVELVTGAICVGAVLLARQSAAGRRFLTLGAAAWAAHLLARLSAPAFFVPQRYVTYPVPVLLVLLVPAAGAAIGERILRGRSFKPARECGIVLMASMILLPFAGRGSSDAGLNIDVTSSHKLYDFVGQLPKDVLVAGWPTELDNIPYLSRRRAFLTWEVHLPFHKAYTDETRRRMRALISAYFATNVTALQRLRDEFGVTHFVFNPQLLEKPPRYFKPYSGWIQKPFSDGQLQGFEIPRQLSAATVFSDGKLFVLDLRRLNGVP